MRHRNGFREVHPSQEDSLLIGGGLGPKILAFLRDNPDLIAINLVETDNVIDRVQVELIPRLQ